jgi:hypothetical protein
MRGAAASNLGRSVGRSRSLITHDEERTMSIPGMCCVTVWPNPVLTTQGGIVPRRPRAANPDAGSSPWPLTEADGVVVLAASCCYSELSLTGVANQDLVKILPQIFLLSDKSPRAPGHLADSRALDAWARHRGKAPAGGWHRVPELAGVSWWTYSCAARRALDIPDHSAGQGGRSCTYVTGRAADYRCPRSEQCA